MLNFQDLPDELVLKILGYSETKHLITFGQVSKRIRRISHDGTLWVTANLKKKIVKTELLEMILQKGCRILNLCHSTIHGSLGSNIKSQLQILNLSHPECYDDNCDFDKNNTGVLEELLFSCCSLQHLAMEGLLLTSKMAVSICKNGKTLQILNLNNSFANGSGCLIEIIGQCQELKEVDLANIGNVENYFLPIFSQGNLVFLANTISQNVEKLNLGGLCIIDDHVEILLRRCNKIKAMNLEATLITDYSLMDIRKYLNQTLEELSLAYIYRFSFNGFLELKSMPRLKILDLSYEKEQIEKLRLHLPNLIINVVKDSALDPFYY